MKIKVSKIRAGGKLPERAHYNDAGADVYATEDVIIGSLETVKIPLGVITEIPDGHMGCIFPRSSLASKGIIAQLPPIDSGYRGEIHAIVSNVSKEQYIVYKGDKIGQLVVIPIILATFTTQQLDSRDTGAFGSTGV